MFGKDWKPVFDTDIFATYRKYLTKKDFQIMSLSILVLYELVARPVRQEEFDLFDGWREKYKNLDRLIIPTYDDIWTSAQAIRKMRLDEQRQHKGTTPAMENATAFQNDALIARTAWTNNCFIVTADVDDFSLFLPFMKNLEIVSAEDFFS